MLQPPVSIGKELNDLGRKRESAGNTSFNVLVQTLGYKAVGVRHILLVKFYESVFRFLRKSPFEIFHPRLHLEFKLSVTLRLDKVHSK